MTMETRAGMANKNGENLSATEVIELEEKFLRLAKDALTAGGVLQHGLWHKSADMLREAAGNYIPTPCFCSAL